VCEHGPRAILSLKLPIPSRIPILYVILSVLVLISVVPMYFYSAQVESINRERLITNERILQNTVTRSLADDISQHQESLRMMLANLSSGLQVASGGEVAYRCIDVTQPQDMRAMVDLAAQRFGRLDVLASVAGIAINAPLNSGELNDWNRMIDVNLRGVLHGIAAALPAFRSQGSGQFVTVASTAAYKWVPGQAVQP